MNTAQNRTRYDTDNVTRCDIDNVTQCDTDNVTIWHWQCDTMWHWQCDKPDLVVCCVTSVHRHRSGSSTDLRLQWLVGISMVLSAALCGREGVGGASRSVLQLVQVWVSGDWCVLAAADCWWLTADAACCCRDEPVYVIRMMNTISSHAINNRCRSISYTNIHQWYFSSNNHYHYRQDAEKRQTAGIKFTHRPKIRFFALQERFVARFASNLAGPTGTWVHLAVQNLTSIATGGGNAATKISKMSTFWLRVAPHGRLPWPIWKIFRGLYA